MDILIQLTKNTFFWRLHLVILRGWYPGSNAHLKETQNGIIPAYWIASVALFSWWMLQSQPDVLGKTAMEALRETIENLWRPALQGWVTFVLATIFPGMDSRLGVDYNGTRLLSHALSLKKKKERGSKPIYNLSLSLPWWLDDGWLHLL